MQRLRESIEFRNQCASAVATEVQRTNEGLRMSDCMYNLASPQVSAAGYTHPMWTDKINIIHPTWSDECPPSSCPCKFAAGKNVLVQNLCGAKSWSTRLSRVGVWLCCHYGSQPDCICAIHAHKDDVVWHSSFAVCLCLVFCLASVLQDAWVAGLLTAEQQGPCAHQIHWGPQVSEINYSNYDCQYFAFGIIHSLSCPL